MTRLTERESRIAELAALGHSNGEIASRLDVTEAVVRAALVALQQELATTQEPSQASRPTVTTRRGDT